MLYFNGKKYFVPFIGSSSGGGIIEVDSLPTENINENAFYLVGGRYYKLDKTGIGTWVFKDELQIPDDFYGKEYHFEYSVNDIPDVGDMEFTALRFYDDGIRYMEYLTVDDGWEAVYQEGVGWFSDFQAYKTITIHEMPTDATFLAWLNDNATPQGEGWVEYVPASINSDLVGTWVFNDVLSMPEEMRGKIYYFGYSTDACVEPMNAMRFVYYGDVKELTYIFDEDNPYIAYTEREGWSDKKYKTITITKAPTDETFIAWLRDNADRESESEYPKYDGKALLAEVNADDESNVYFIARFDTPTVVEHHVISQVPLSTFGDAQRSDVRKGVWFTSSAGLEIQGTNEGGIIEVDALPTENIDKNTFYLVDGKYYRWVGRTYTFKDVIIIPYTMYGKSYYFSYSSNGVKLNEIQFSDDGAIHSMSYANNETGYYAEVYDDNRGWEINNESYKTIDIHEMPTDETFLSWLNDNATQEEGWVEYNEAIPEYDGKLMPAVLWNEDERRAHFRTTVDKPIVVTKHILSSVSVFSFGNARPEDVRKGVIFTSSAGVKSVGTYEPTVEVEEVDELPTKRIPPGRTYLLRGKYYKYDETNVWVFDENLGANDAYELMNKTYEFEFSVNIPNVGKVRMTEMRFEFDGTYLALGYHNNEYDLDEAYNERYGWADEMYRTIEIHTKPDDAEFNAWLFDVAMVEGTWVEYSSMNEGAVTEIQTPEELDNILANATSSDVGKAYVFVGESNSKYKNGSIYIIREV